MAVPSTWAFIPPTLLTFRRLHPRLAAEVARTDISNVGEDGQILDTGDRRRMYSLGNRLRHTDASLQDPPGRYSLLSARVVAPLGADTEFADMRAAYDALPDDMTARLEGLDFPHSIAFSPRRRASSSRRPRRER